MLAYLLAILHSFLKPNQSFIFNVCDNYFSDVMLSKDGLHGQAIWVPVANSSSGIFTKWCYIWSLGWGKIRYFRVLFNRKIIRLSVGHL